MFRLDSFGEPQFAVRKEKADWSKNNVSSGDTLALKHKSDLSVDEKVTIGVHVTISGMPDDCNFIGNIDCSKETKLEELKEQILHLPTFKKETGLKAERLRLREKLNNMYFGKIYRDNKNRSVTQLGIKNKS